MKIQHICTDPRYKAAQAKLQDLQQQLQDATDARQKIQHTNFVDYQDALAQEAQSLLDGKPVRETSVDVEVEMLSRRCTILRRAIEIQTQELSRVRNEISSEICEAARPEYEILANDVVQAVKVLRDALASEFRLRTELDMSDVAFTSAIRVCAFPLHETHGAFMCGIDNFLRHAAEKGYE